MTVPTPHGQEHIALLIEQRHVPGMDPRPRHTRRIETLKARAAVLANLPAADRPGAISEYAALDALTTGPLILALPTDGADDLVPFGAVLGPVDPYEPILRQVTLPAGWTVDHPNRLWSELRDQHGRPRASVFRKRDYWDRRPRLVVYPLATYAQRLVDTAGAPVFDDWCTPQALRDAITTVTATLAEQFADYTGRAARGVNGAELAAQRRRDALAAWQALADRIPDDVAATAAGGDQNASTGGQR